MSIVASGSGGGGEARRIYPTLTSTNYTSWCIHVQAIMEDREEWEIVEPAADATVPTAAEAEKIKAKDKKIKANLLQCIPDDILMQVAKKKTGEEVWDSLKARFVGADRVRDARLQTLKSQFDAVEMKEDESLDQVVGKLTALSVKCSSLGGSIGDADLVKKLFDIVPDRYLTVVAGKGKRGDGSWRGQGSGRGGNGGGRGSGADAGKDGTGKRDKSHIKCFKCHGYGHYANRCPGEKKKEEAHLVKAGEKEPIVLLAERLLPDQLQYQLHSQTQNTDSRMQRVFLNELKVVPELHLSDGGGPSCGVWYLDNGASNHMTGDVLKFRDLDHAVLGKGRGTIVFEGKHGDHWVLSDVYYIPKLRSNLVSLGQLTETGHRIILDDDLLEVCEKHSDRMIMRVPRTLNRLYKIELKTMEPRCLIADINDQAWLWHGRLGHVNFRALSQLVGKGMASGVPEIRHPEQVCSDCLTAKQTRMSFPKSTSWHADEKLTLVYVDLCGPVTPATAGGNMYFILLVDDHTRWMQVYLLKSKDQAVDYFAKYKAKVENFTGSKAHRLFEPSTNKIIVSRDVVFEESTMWNWGVADKAENSVDFVVENEVEIESFSVGGSANVDENQ
ncbi:unnamed protein product [Miscanthus lutarioriparius]|uniref:CCHC-type domain-containing protein n=1 Tax=Miscanthus lutarioriparius TaxID=422564 RepID=A0A811RKS5_9POAL|nr:unnamed protein product [Miscanthus lutarioriparius]